MKKGKNETPKSRLGDKSPRGSILEKPMLLNQGKLASFPKPQFTTIEEELSHLPYKENEVQALAKQIGIDYEAEKDKYLWFLVQIVNLDLPPGWMREEDPSGAIYYHNPNENVNSSKHPMISKFRSLFNEILEFIRNEILGKAKMLALKEKVRKLEQQEKESSPKKQPLPAKSERIKKNANSALVKGTKGDLVLEKGLKGVPDQPQGIVDTERAKERFDKVKEVLEKRRTVHDERINEVDNLIRTEEILNKCKQEYIEHYGLFHIDAPPSIIQMESFDTVDPTEIIEAARLFNIKSSQAYLFWIIRAYCGLPLPEYWNKVFDTNLHREIYYNSCFNVKISVKPCYFYILELINFVKQEAIRDKESFLHFSNKMTLCDKLGRQYDVDIASMIKDLIEKPTKERKNYFTYHQKKELPKEEAQKVIRKKKKDEHNPNYSDAHFIEIANQIGIDLNTELHLLMVIEEYVRSRETVERWFFRQVPDGPAFWVNHEQQKAVNRYPYAKELQKIIEEARASLKNNLEDSKKHLKTEWNLVRTLFRKHPEPVARKMILDEAKNFVEFFLKLKGDSQKTGSSLETKGYNLSNLLRKIGTQISKQDIMDLLFYCPFDFSQFISEDFLKSTESYLLKKIHLKSVGGKAQDSMNDLGDIHMHHDASFDSHGSNDSAKRIRLKIEDSKKLLDMAANIKGLNLDPEKKREFMKLLIDFDQKYGDHDLVDALEKDITENIADEAALTQNLVDTIKAKMDLDNQDNEMSSSQVSPLKSEKNNLILQNLLKNLDDSENDNDEAAQLEGAEIVEGFSKSSLLKKRDSSRAKRDKHVTISQTEFDNNNNNSSQRKSPNKVRSKTSENDLDASAESLDLRSPSPGESKSTTSKKLNSKKSINKESNFNQEATDQEEDENQDFKGDLGAYKSRKSLPKKEIEEGGMSFGEEINQIEKDNIRRMRKSYEYQEIGDQKTKQSDAEKIKDHTRNENEESSDQNQNLNKTKRRRKNRSSGLDETLIKLKRNEEGENDGELIDTSELEEETNEEGQKKKKMRVPGFKNLGHPEKDENGKILFTNRRTQEILENLVEAQARHSSRSQSKNHTGRAGSKIEGDDLDEFDENNIIYKEVIMENGEKKLIPIGIHARSSQKNSKIFGIYDNSPSKNKDDRLSPSSLNQNKESKGEDGLPMIIGSSYKYKLDNYGENKSHNGKFDPQYLIEYLNRYNVNIGALDGKKKERKKNLKTILEAYTKDEKRKSELASRNRYYTGEDSKVADATGLSNSRYLITTPSGNLKKLKKGNEKTKPQQTYKSLEAGLQHLDRVYKNKHYEKSGKPGVWTHVEVFEVGEGAFGETNNPTNQNQAFGTHKTPSVTHYIEDSGKYHLHEQTFYTPYRKGNLGARRFVEYMTYLNTVVFLRKLDTMITDFLIRQFTRIQQNNLGIDFKPEDPTFRIIFKRRYYKLIKKLRENLLKKRDFIQKVYSKIFISPENIPNVVYQSLESLKNSPKGRKESSPNRTGDKNFSLGTFAPKNDQFQEFKIENNQNKSLGKLHLSQSSLKLPALVDNRRNTMDKFRTSQTNLKAPTTLESNMFDDKSMRKNGSTGPSQTPDYIKARNEERSKNSRKTKIVLNQKELDAQKILRAINENDKENYKHYWSLLGDPLNLDSSIIFSKAEIPIGIQPYHIFLMGHRLGIQIQNIEEPDLAWIAYLVLVTKLPSNVEINFSITSPKNKMRIQKICNMKIGEHPGDKYFKTVLIYNQMRRKILLEAMPENDQTALVKALSWTKLREDSGVIYYYNFLTKQKTHNFPIDQKEASNKLLAFSSKPEIKEKLKLINQIMTENDDLLTIFKNKSFKN